MEQGGNLGDLGGLNGGTIQGSGSDLSTALRE